MVGAAHWPISSVAVFAYPALTRQARNRLHRAPCRRRRLLANLRGRHRQARNRESDSFLYSETMKAMRRHLALQSTSCEMTGDGCFVLRELLECVRVLAPLFHTVTMRTCIKG